MRISTRPAESSSQLSASGINNRSERSIKPFVIGRKNWLFSNTPKGATAGATIYSNIETTQENGLKAFGYLQRQFDTTSQLENFNDPATLDRFLSRSESVPQEFTLAQP